MINKDYNNDFFGWQGSISRKNYSINMLIVIFSFFALYFINFNAFEPYIPFKILFTILIFLADLLRIVLVMSMLSLVYRRISDFSGTKPYEFQMAMKRLFVFLFVFPVLYLLCFRYFFDFIPLVIHIFDLLTFFVLIPLALISSIVFCFIKGL